MLQTLSERVAAVHAESTTSLADDEAALVQLQHAAGGATAKAASWQEVALQYRMERKRLAAAADTVLSLYGSIIDRELEFVR